MTIGLGRDGHGVLRLIKPGVYLYFCPRCAVGHTFNISASDHPDGKKWGFDGDTRRPSIDGELVFPGCRHEIRGGVIHYSDGTDMAMVDYPR